MKTQNFATSACLALLLLLATPARAQEPLLPTVSGYCPAAEILRELFPDLLSEEEFLYYSTYACPLLGLFVEGKPYTVAPDDVQAKLSSSGLEATAAANQQDSVFASNQAVGVDLPYVDDGDSFLSRWTMGFTWPERDGSGRLDEIPFGVTPLMDNSASDPALLAMQKQYLEMGCTETPELRKCLNSAYAKYLSLESGYGDGK